MLHVYLLILLLVSHAYALVGVNVHTVYVGADHFLTFGFIHMMYLVVCILIFTCFIVYFCIATCAHGLVHVCHLNLYFCLI